MPHFLTKKSGFTLIEMLVVIAIIIIITTAAWSFIHLNRQDKIIADKNTFEALSFINNSKLQNFLGKKQGGSIVDQTHIHIGLGKFVSDTEDISTSSIFQKVYNQDGDEIPAGSENFDIQVINSANFCIQSILLCSATSSVETLSGNCDQIARTNDNSTLSLLVSFQQDVISFPDYPTAVKAIMQTTHERGNASNARYIKLDRRTGIGTSGRYTSTRKFNCNL